MVKEPLFFHATYTKHQEGERIAATRRTSNCRARGVVEVILERGRPSDACSREEALYTTRYPAYTLVYIQSELARLATDSCKKGSESIHVYEVELAVSEPHPMALVDRIRSISLKNTPIVQEIVSEYWNPTKDWRFLEYITNSVRITRELETTSISLVDRTVAFMTYQRDYKMAKDLWPNQ